MLLRQQSRLLDLGWLVIGPQCCYPLNFVRRPTISCPLQASESEYPGSPP